LKKKLNENIKNPPKTVARFQDHSNSKDEPHTQKPVEVKPQPTTSTQQPVSRFDTKKRLSKVPQRVENYVPSLDAEEFASMSEMGKSTSEMKTTEVPKTKPPVVPRQKPSQRASNLFGKMDNAMVNDNKELTESEKEEMKKQIKK